MQKGPLRVLVVNHSFPPDTSATAGVFRDLVARLDESGHEVTVLTGRPCYAPTERRAWRPFRREQGEHAVVERVGSTAFERHRLAGRVANYLSYLGLAALRGLVPGRFGGPSADVVISGTDPPIAVWVALLAAKGRPVVYSLRDLHPDMAVATEMIHPGALTRVWDRIHTAGLRRCALIVCLGETMAARVRAKGVAPERIAVVPDGAWPAQGSPDPRVVAELRVGAEFVVMHAGNLGGYGPWETLVSAARSLQGSGCSFNFVGDGFWAERLRDEPVRLAPFRPPGELSSVMAAGDLQVVAIRRGAEGAVVPSKLYTVLAHARPVLVVAPEESETAQIVRDHGCGLLADPDDPEDVVAKVRWAQSHPEALEQMSRRAGAAAVTFERGGLLGDLVSLVEHTAAAT